MSQARWIIGDTLTVLRTMPDASVDLVLSSPPFLALRSYLPADHPDKDKEIGSEATPGEFIDTLLDIVEECRRVLAPHGSLCFELGDTYSGGAGGAGGDYGNEGLRAGQLTYRQQQMVAPKTERGPKLSDRLHNAGAGNKNRDKRPGWPLDKSLALVPELFRIALAYGFNPLTGRTTPRWRVRNVVRWVRPNPPVGALGDKFRPATSDMVIACMARDRYFDLDAVRTEPTSNHKSGEGVGNSGAGINGYSGVGRDVQTRVLHPAGAPPLDWWKISTQPYAGSHYATFPEQLCVRPIKAMCPERVCRVCGEPSRRITGDTEEYAAFKADNEWPSGGKVTANLHRPNIDFSMVRSTTTGWTDCGHDNYRPGVVLDPFAGSGTTLSVATGHGRDAIGIDLDERNAELAVGRIGGFFVTVEDHRTAGVA